MEMLAFKLKTGFNLLIVEYALPKCSPIKFWGNIVHTLRYENIVIYFNNSTIK